MTTKMQISTSFIQEIQKELQQIEESKNKINEILSKVIRLAEPDVWNIGDRVQLTYKWSSFKRRLELKPKWAPFIHFMSPVNHATIVNVYADSKGLIKYEIRFDRQYDLFNGQIDRTFIFNKEDLIKI